MLKLSHIDKTFDPGTVNEMQVFKDFHLTVEAGEFICIIGSNGSGKTSLLNMICGASSPNAGAIDLDGENLLKVPEHKRYRHIGRVFQDPSLGTCPKLTVLENLSMADNKGKPWDLTRGIQKDRIDFYRTALSQFGLGLENKLNDRVSTLSGGQRQSIALLMSTLTPIRFLILDEHTAALDPKTADLIMRFTDQIVREKKLTALMITHNLNYALQYGNRLLMMHEGKIVLDKKGEEKKKISLQELLDQFDRISIEKGNDI